MNSQMALLWVIDEWNGSSAESIAEVLGVSVGDISEDVAALYFDGLLDMRWLGGKVCLCITDAGAEALKGSEPPEDDDMAPYLTVGIPDWVF